MDKYNIWQRWKKIIRKTSRWSNTAIGKTNQAKLMERFTLESQNSKKICISG